MNPVFSTSSYGRHTRDQMRQLAEWGFTHILMCQNDPGSWKGEVELAHEYGLKAMVRWPNWALLGCLGEDMAFRNQTGNSNVSGGSLTTGPSVWNPESAERAIDALPELVADGWDGVLVHILNGDRPMPTAWHTSRHREWKDWYWSFDEWAKAEYGALRRPQPMPGIAKPMDNLEFYRWYQQGWLRRLNTFTASALEHFSEIATWFIPMNWWEKETMADGTADSTGAITQWQETVLNSGGEPLVVVAHMFGMGDQWEPKARKTMQEQNAVGWRSIVGAECNPGVAAKNLVLNGRQAQELGFSGLLCGDAALFEEAAAIRPFAEWWQTS